MSRLNFANKALHVNKVNSLLHQREIVIAIIVERNVICVPCVLVAKKKPNSNMNMVEENLVTMVTEAHISTSYIWTIFQIKPIF